MVLNNPKRTQNSSKRHWNTLVHVILSWLVYTRLTKHNRLLNIAFYLEFALSWVN